MTKLFGEDGAKIQPDEFFLIFDNFLTAFNEAKIENETLRKKKAEEEKRLKVRWRIFAGFEIKRTIGDHVDDDEVLTCVAFVLTSVWIRLEGMDSFIRFGVPSRCVKPVFSLVFSNVYFVCSLIVSSEKSWAINT